MDHPPKQVKLDIRPEWQAPAEQGQRQEQALDIFPNPVEGPDDLAPGPSSGPSSGPSPGPVQIASMETDVAIHRQLVAQAETNVALARDNLSFAEVMVVDIRERSREADVAAFWELLVQAEEDLRHAHSVYILSFFSCICKCKVFK